MPRPETERKLTTCHHDPWGLVRRGGDTTGKRIATRMAFLVGTIAGEDGKAVALTGYIMNADMTGWTKHVRRIEWTDIVKRWHRQPSVADVRRVKRRLPIATDEIPRAFGNVNSLASNQPRQIALREQNAATSENAP